MIVSMIKISSAFGKQREVIDILLSVRGPTLAASGCLECSIYDRYDEEYDVLYLEEWQTWEDLVTHIRTSLYARVLKALELSARQPEIRFYEIAGKHGIELVESVRG